MDEDTSQAAWQYSEELKRQEDEEMDNLALWNRLSRTDPRHTKQFTRAGGFKGTAIKPMWAIKRATEEWGPIGNGWGWDQIGLEIIDGADGQKLVYVAATVWYTENGEKYETGPQWGGDFITKLMKGNLVSDDEAIKKALTDAVSKCLSYIGIGADVHMGQFDDSKYVEEVKREYGAKEQQAAEQTHQQALEDCIKRRADDVQNIKIALSFYLDPTQDGADCFGKTEEEIQATALKDAASCWFPLPNEDKMLLFTAPSKGGPFTTQELKAMRLSEFRKAYYGDQ